MSYDRDTAKRFRQFRLKHIGPRQQDAADICECSQKYISEIESGKSDVGLDTMRHLVRKKKLNANWFLTGTGSMVMNLPDQRKLVHDISEIAGDIGVLFAMIENQGKQIKLLASKLRPDYAHETSKNQHNDS